MKRILSLMLVLLLLFSAGCKQQDAEPATPGEVVEKTETGTSEADLPEVIEQEENAPADTDPEQKPLTEDETEDEADNSVTATNTEDDFDKEAWLADYLVTAEKIYERMEEVSKMVQEDIYFHYEIFLTDYPMSVYWESDRAYKKAESIPPSAIWYTKLDPLPDFNMIDATEIREISLQERENLPRIWTRIIYINKSKNSSKESMISDLKTLISLDCVSKVTVHPHYNAQD